MKFSKCYAIGYAQKYSKIFLYKTLFWCKSCAIHVSHVWDSHENCIVVHCYKNIPSASSFKTFDPHCDFNYFLSGTSSQCTRRVIMSLCSVYTFLSMDIFIRFVLLRKTRIYSPLSVSDCTSTEFGVLENSLLVSGSRSLSLRLQKPLQLHSIYSSSVAWCTD